METLYMLVFVVETMVNGAKVFEYVPTNSPLLPERICKMMMMASSDRMDCIEERTYRIMLELKKGLENAPDAQ